MEGSRLTAPAIFSDDFYARLGLPHSASQDEVKRAYLQLVRRHPPERAPEEFKRIREAYETLINPRTREEYDRHPEPLVERWLAQALAAMKAQDYKLAERYFKEALIKAPGLDFVRNMLGLCFLYQADAERAIAQYERLLRSPEANATWWANAGHAYRMAQRFNEAERAFQEAILRSDDVSVDYYIGLADVYLDQKNHDKAKKVLEKGIRADEKLDFQDLRFLTKLLEVHLRGTDQSGVRRDLNRVKQVAVEEDQKKYAAWKLGELAQKLIVARGFDYAIPVVETAKELQPRDPDYFALLQLATQLRQNNFTAVRGFLRVHRSFQPQQWLNPLRQAVEAYCDENRLFEGMQPIDSAPGLSTINGVGTMLYGQRDVDPRTGSYVATLCFVVLFIPIFPIACYRVIPRGGRTWSFLGRVPFSDRERWHLRISLGVVAALVIWGVVSNGTSSNSVSGYVPPAPSSTRLPFAAAPPEVRLPSGSGTSDNFQSWYDTEKARIDAMEYEIRSMDRELAAKSSEIDNLKARIRAIEGGYSSVTTSDYTYNRLLNEHNNLVEEYNALFARRGRRYREYESALDAANLRIQAHNARP